MEKPESQKFEIKSTMEQTPFECLSAQVFFKKWCEANDSIEPKFVSRVECEEKRENGILSEQKEEKRVLFLPEDLHLWEMVGVMETVDRDTFSDRKPERAEEKKKEMAELGEMFRNSGAYLAERLSGIKEGREIAETLAEEFYEYGESILSGEKPHEISLEKIAEMRLSPEETEKVDRWLAGEKLYASRRVRAEKTNEEETERQKTLAQFFKVVEKTFELETKTENGEIFVNRGHLKPWKTGASFHSAFLSKMQKAIIQKIEMPKRELTDSVFRRGFSFLQNMPFDILPEDIKNSFFHWQDGESTLRESLQVDRLKKELETVRLSGDITKISKKEREIAEKIQKAVSEFPFQKGSDKPSEIIKNQSFNCLGFSMVGGSLMQEAGLSCLAGDMPSHSTLFLVTDDEHVWLMDMQSSTYNKDIKNEMITNEKKDEAVIRTRDIVAFSKHPTPKGLMFDLESDIYKELEKDEKSSGYATAFELEYGLKIQLLNNMATTFCRVAGDEPDRREKENYYNLAIKTYREAIALNPEYALPYYGLGKIFFLHGINEEAVDLYRQSIKIHPSFPNPYFDLGNIFFETNRYDEAIELYKKFLELANKEKYNDWIKLAIRRIEEMQNKRTQANPHEEIKTIN